MLKKENEMAKHTFATREQVDAFCDELDKKDVDYGVVYYPHLKMYVCDVREVKTSQIGYASHIDEMRDYNKLFDERDARKREEDFRDATRDIAHEVGYKLYGEGYALGAFVKGFMGVSAKKANPRKTGNEDAYKAGKAAVKTEEMKRKIQQAVWKMNGDV